MHTLGPDVSQGGAGGDLSHRHGQTFQNALGVSLTSIITPKSYKGTLQFGASKHPLNKRQEPALNSAANFITKEEASKDEKPVDEATKPPGNLSMNKQTSGLRKSKKVVQPVLKKIDLQQALLQKQSGFKDKSQESIDADQVDLQNTSHKYSLNSSTAQVAVRFKPKDKTLINPLMNQSITKLSEQIRNNSSTSSIGGTGRSKLKLKFKHQSGATNKHGVQIVGTSGALTSKSSIVEKHPELVQSQVSKKVNTSLVGAEVRRDRNSRIAPARVLAG